MSRFETAKFDSITRLLEAQGDLMKLENHLFNGMMLLVHCEASFAPRCGAAREAMIVLDTLIRDGLRYYGHKHVPN